MSFSYAQRRWVIAMALIWYYLTRRLLRKRKRGQNVRMIDMSNAGTHGEDHEEESSEDEDSSGVEEYSEEEDASDQESTEHEESSEDEDEVTSKYVPLKTGPKNGGMQNKRAMCSTVNTVDWEKPGSSRKANTSAICGAKRVKLSVPCSTMKHPKSYF